MASTYPGESCRDDRRRSTQREIKVGKFIFEPIPALIACSIAALVALGIHYFTGFNFLAVLAMTLIAMWINGVVAEAEDNAPGGFNNPLPRPMTRPTTSDGAV